VFDAASVKVYVTVVTPTGKVEPEVWDSVLTKAFAASTLSVAVGAVQFITVRRWCTSTSGIWIVWSEGQPAIVGIVVSCTATVNEQLEDLLSLSVNTHDTVDVPIGYRVPDAFEHVPDTYPSVASIAHTGSTHVEVVPPADKCVEEADNVRLVGHEVELTNGAKGSVTVTTNEQLALFEAASVKVYVTVVAPTVNVEPGACVVNTVSEFEASTLSVAVGGVHDTAVRLACTSLSGIARVCDKAQACGIGGETSVTLTKKEHVLDIFAESEKRQATAVEPRANELFEVLLQTAVTYPSVASGARIGSCQVATVPPLAVWVAEAFSCIEDGHVVLFTYGACGSVTVIEKVHTAEFELPSVNTYCTAVDPIGNMLLGAMLSVRVRVLVAYALSVAVGALQLTAVCCWWISPAGICNVRDEGHPAIVGRVLSTTVTTNVQVLERESESVKVHVTVVDPTAKYEPDAREHVPVT
jgi:hypothetical protein